MRLTCTCCGATGSIEMFSADVDARRAVEIAAGMPAQLGPLALRYLGLFRPHKRGLAWDRVCKLLGELAAMIAAGQVERRGKPVPASAESFGRAMQQMLDQRERLELPLANHHYLVAIVAGNAPREAAAAEDASEALRRMASAQRGSLPSRVAIEIASEEASRKRLRMAPLTQAERDQIRARMETDE